ncbi:PREDICTED: uncharacterized protein LOC104611141 [Nelumbo nucifera]|uniref:Uncharacterized protein LOC104611141 n=1 Tax=Nelumbo nucifera TaxID=4432 RepID=A0A1U8B5X6_NELNU|nr:PREDICTED: uncharacterized protein LOC104611141 [Nelumbo nucifera]XP_010276374.1 PREDICTED: uncharacterized protein LOC104611141 [Nelumbo nucifera]
MEKEAKNQATGRAPETDFLLQWGNRKRLRCMKVKGEDGTGKGNGVIKRKITTRVDRRVVRVDKETPPLQLNTMSRNSNLATLPSSASENRKSSSPEKEDRYYTTRGSLGFDDNNAKILMDAGEDRGFVWPKLFISLSSKEKEEDFMKMKGCKLPQRPKKRAKYIQKTILLVSPGAWLSDLCQERYEVREKKTSKKRPRGLKAMSSMESDSE